MTRFYGVERSVLHSPAWFVPVDEFTGRVRAAGVAVELDRFDAAANAWLPEDVRAVRTPSAAIAYPGLGRRGAPARFRARFTAAGFAPLYPADDEPFAADVVGVEFRTFPYDEDRPPVELAAPRVVRLLPGTAFPYGPGVRTAYGVAVDAATRVPVANALVAAEGVSGVEGVPWRERTLTDGRGAFRLALRWEGGAEGADETFRLVATERPGRTGSVLVRLPADRGRGHVIEITGSDRPAQPNSRES
ncbi:carboxypeptidase regulatory-like domain-containing protein [Umezawaea sp.]|uniref:carboxypeptidase regulatory-like domain-containing protein n=1 Tax=Umezawaea sp. TaxID=1955258 RepID=UPI002ED63EF5